MKKFLEKTEDIVRKIVSCKFLYYVIIMALFIAVYYIDFKLRLQEDHIQDMSNHIKYFFITSGAIGIVTLILVIFSKKIYQKLEPHIVYMILGLILGGIYCCVVPLCAQSDEPSHLYRVFQAAQGEIIAPIKDNEFKTELPQSVIDMVNVNNENKKREYKKYYDIKEMMKIKLNENEKTEISTVGNYNGLSYFPQLVGVKIGLVLKLNPYYIAMLGRISSLIITILLLSFGIKKLPKHKLFATIVLLSPVVLSYAASFTTDNAIIVTAFLIISYVLHFMESKEKIKWWEYIIFAMLTFIIAISKMAYLPLVGLWLFIPKECFKKPRNKWIFAVIFILLGLISTLWWMKAITIDTGVTAESTDTNAWIYKNPIGYLTVLFRTIAYNSYSYIENMFAGHFLCHNQVSPYAIIPVSYIIIVVMAFFSDENKKKTTMYQKIIVTGIILVSFAMIATAMYLYNTSFKNPTIIGVQGRYLLPLLLLAVFFANRKKLDIEEYKLVNVALIANYGVYLAMLTKFFV